MRLGQPLMDALDLLLPPCCALCSETLDARKPPVCPGCWHRLPGIPHPRCRRCGATSLTPSERDGCPACTAWPAETLRTASAYRMEGDAARLLRLLKYRGWTALAPRMGGALERPARELIGPAKVPPEEVVLTPVPIAPSRLRERGFNQAELLSMGLGRALGSDVRNLLARPGGRRPQTRLARRERLANVREQFRATDATLAARTRVLLVDDVVTTGATAAACAATLEAARCRVIGLVSFARAWQTLEPAGNSPVRM